MAEGSANSGRQDHTEPSLGDIETAIAFIREKQASGVRVYVHCKGGNGRSAAIAFCWLLYARNMTLLEAQTYLSEKRRVRKTLYQQPVIVAFYDRLQLRKEKEKEKET